MGHQTGEGDDVQTGDRIRQPLVVPRQAAEAAHPGKGALHDPASREEDEAAFGLRKPHDLQRDTTRGGGGRRDRPGVGGVDGGEFDRLPGRRLDRLAQGRDLVPVLGVRRG